MSEEASRKRSNSPTATMEDSSDKRVAVEDQSTFMPVPGGAVKSAPAPVTTCTIRAIIDGKEAGSIIGKGGVTVNLIREKSGAKVQLSDSPPAHAPNQNERVLSVQGNAEAIFRAFTFICDKVRDANTTPGLEAPTTLRAKLAIPHTQAGAVIGKAGQKIKDIRDATGSQMTVDKEFLPGSSERCCTVTGTLEAVSQSIFHIACTLIQTPSSGSAQPYQPGGLGGLGAAVRQHGAGQMGMGAMGGGMMGMQAGAQFGFSNPSSQPQLTEQITIPNEVIGSVIGKGGSKIQEIRTVTGAQIKVMDNASAAGTTERAITIIGSAEAIQMARYLIQKTAQDAQQANFAKQQAAGGI
jgi:poly(rC)-binding protein 2/3/4